MYFSFEGIISYIGEDYVAIEVNNIGYQLFVTHIEQYHLGETRKLYAYNVVREDEQYLAGFSSLEEKKAFLDLISVKGIGPRSALNALSATTPTDLYNAISANNVAYLKKLPNIGSKAAAQIILDLKGQLVEGSKANIDQYGEVRAALKSLGFKVKEIDEVLVNISIPNGSNEDIIRAALKKLSK